MLKKLALAAMMALGLIAMLAPAAQAQNKPLTVLQGGVPLTDTTEIELTGPAKFTGALGGIESTLHLKLHIPADNTGTGTITSLVTTNPEAFGLYWHCSVTSSEAAGLPWTVHAEETTAGVKTLDITNPQFQKKLSGFLCPSELNTTGGTVIATPDNPTEISSVTLSGTVTTTAGNWTASGTLNVVEPHTGILGLG